MKFRLLMSALLAMAASASANASDSLLNLAPLYKETVASNPGIEMIHPYVRYVDTNVDGMPDSVVFQFNVYPVNSNIKLFSTAGRTVPVAAIPCTSPLEVDVNLSNGKFLGELSPTRSHVALVVITSCVESGTGEFKEAFNTLVYSADVSAPGGLVWSKVYALDLLSFDGVDVDGDATNELVVGLAVSVTGLANPESENLRSIALEGNNGAVVFDKTRLLVR